MLHETGATHERSGQLAMGVSVLEDVVAAVKAGRSAMVFLRGAGSITGQMMEVLDQFSRHVRTDSPGSKL